MLRNVLLHVWVQLLHKAQEQYPRDDDTEQAIRHEQGEQPQQGAHSCSLLCACLVLTIACGWELEGLHLSKCAMQLFLQWVSASLYTQLGCHNSIQSKTKTGTIKIEPPTAPESQHVTEDELQPTEPPMSNQPCLSREILWLNSLRQIRPAASDAILTA